MIALVGAPALQADAAVIPEGIYAGERSLGGMEEDDALTAVEEYVAGLAGQQITMDVNGVSAVTTAQELGFSWSNRDQVKADLEEYTSGNVIRRYFKKKDLEKTPQKVDIRIKLEGSRVAEFVQNQCEPLVQEAVDATIHRENGTFVITPSQTGLTVDQNATIKTLNEALAQGLEEPVMIDAAVTVSEPKVTEEMLGTIQDVLGTCSTSFSSSGAARSKNLKVGSGKINGTVLLPGETLSGYEMMAPFTLENGYASAGAYENGQVVDSIGGGVCQIATTLYDAALQAEMEIVQRQNHSMIVTYVKPSMDAAIAGTYKDIKIKNNYSTPVYIEGYTSGKKLTFTLYGKETRPSNRQVEYVSETIGTTNPGEPQMITDKSLAPGAKVKVQSAHTGYKSRLWKVVTVDGVEQERTLLNEDTYNASKAIYRVGPAHAAPAPVPEQTAPATTPETAENHTPETAQTEPAQTEAEHKAVTGENGGPGVVPTTAAQPAGDNAGAESPASPAQEENP